jgi:hypothetical protein
VIAPASDLTDAMFQDVTLLADYSHINADDAGAGRVAGYMAVTIKKALNTAGFQWKTNREGKGEFAFSFHGHYDLTAPDAPVGATWPVAGSTETTSPIATAAPPVAISYTPTTASAPSSPALMSSFATPTRLPTLMMSPAATSASGV